MHNKLDQFFKRKLKNRSFEFEDAYWAEMEQLLPAKKENKKPWLWLMLVFGGILFMTYWMLLPDEAASKQPISHKQENPQSQSSTIAPPNQIDENTEPATANLSRPTPAKHQPGKGTLHPAQQGNIPSPKSQNDQVHRTAAQTGQSAHLHTNRMNAQASDHPNSDPVAPPTGHILRKPTENQQAQLAPAYKANPPSTIKINLQTRKQKIKENLSIRQQTILTRLHTTNPSPLPPSSPTPSIPKYHRYRLRHWQWGIVAESRPVGTSTQWKAGLSLRYRLTSFFSLGTELKYSYHPGHFNSVSVLTDSTFSFGYTQNEVRVQLDKLHSLNMPAYASLDIGRQSILVGLEVQKILAGQGRLTTYQATQTQPNLRTIQDSKTIWLSTQDLAPVNTYLLVGGEHQLGKLAIGFRGYYHLRRLSPRPGDQFRLRSKPASWSVTLRIPLTGKTKNIKN